MRRRTTRTVQPQAWRQRALTWLSAAICLVLTGTAPVFAGECETAGRAAELAAGLPDGLLLAVGHVESGRRDPLLGSVHAWPWTIDVAGQARFFPDKESAVRVTQTLLDSGQRNIDVGCFQVSLLHHPLAFASLDQAFDPAANAQYAAKFLASLERRYGDWSAAVAAYHSADPALGWPYRKLVFAAWQIGDDAGTTSQFGMHVWTPGESGDAPQFISLHPAGDSAGPALPRVITSGLPRLGSR